MLLTVACLSLLAAAPPPARQHDPEPPGNRTFSNSLGMKFALVKAGTFRMGAPKDDEDADDAEKPQHEVTITRDYYLGVHEVTQKQYEKVMGKNPSAFRKGGDDDDAVKGLDTSDFPVEMVSWDDAQAFLKKLNALPGEKMAGVTYRLPTEAEWEYACRGGHLIRRLKAKAELPFHFKRPSDSLGAGQANFNADSPQGKGKKGPALDRTCKVGSFAPNALGLFDVHGNVDEWCADWFGAEYYSTSPKKDPRGPARGEERVIRGGSWDSDGVECRASGRTATHPTTREDAIGFRVVALPSGK
jgi:formylglycine-generating enzyme required for sulfatase activity